MTPQADQPSGPPIVAALGIARWKRATLAPLLSEGRPVRFLDTAAPAIERARAEDGALAIWPSRVAPDLARHADVPLVRVEDGFIRSVGLGAGLHPPLSIVADQRGIYYDPGGPSDLEHLLQTHALPPELLARAERLAATIVAGGISKYGATPPGPATPGPATSREAGRRTVLVAGQVEDDLSVRLGGAGVAGNLDLLARARRAEPDAHILFKPHPDVDAGFRAGRVPDAALLAHADAVVRGEGMPALLARVDAVHVLSSLTGFEALLRGLEVTVHGHPFYAGWGLTRDLAGPVPRRTRRLTLPMLVAGALILYPRYLDPVTGLRCEPEQLLARFAGGWRPPFRWLTFARRLQGRLARALGRATD